MTDIHHYHVPGGLAVTIQHNVAETPRPKPAASTTPVHAEPETAAEQLRETRHQLGHALAHLVDADIADPAILADVADVYAACVDLSARTAAHKQTIDNAAHAAALAAFAAKE